MKAIVVMFDTLSRRYLPNYGNDWVHAPNFKRLGERSVTFDKAYVGSMPCMPARRDYQTGRPNFLHRSWGPMEPFDDSMPRMLSDAGVHTHISTDHNHYFEDGGLNYHTQFTTWTYWRGQEGDPWIGDLREPQIPERTFGKNGLYSNAKLYDNYTKVYSELDEATLQRRRYLVRQDWINRQFLNVEENFPQARTFKDGLKFIDRNADEDNWMLHIETFDPHEPFYTLDRYKELYAEHYRSYEGPFYDWPMYEKSDKHPDEVAHLKIEYAALISMCDEYLGKVLDMMDEKNLWDDTMLIVWTDHGFLMGEHDWWGKMSMPMYQEVAHTPFFIWDPRSGKRGERRDALVQPSLDLAPTLLRFFGQEPTERMTGQDLAGVVQDDTPVRDMAIFGNHGGHVNITDGRYVYMKAPANTDNQPLHQYTLMPTHMRSFFAVKDFHDMELAEPFPFTKGARTMKISNTSWVTHDRRFDTMLWDTEADPGQENELQNAELEAQLQRGMVRLMEECHAPDEQYERLGLVHLRCREEAAPDLELSIGG
ncbi:sulfatase [Marinovum sp.]|uniref:sulfatase n=1 Tax=Marinovum sp. TaxID=2024839 RepID=UPI003A9156F3